MTILTPERLAEIAERADSEVNDESGSLREQQARKDRVVLLASHAALQAEVERLRKVEASCIQLVENATNARVEAIEAHRLRRIAQTEAAHASESAAREMRERCAAVVNEARGTSYDLRGIAAAINALPLTPTKENADG